MLQVAPYFGYLASLLLIIALLMSNDLKFRWFTAAGNIAFICYALLLNAFPVLITNCILLTINAAYLVRVYSRKEKFDLIEFTGEEKMVRKFMEFHQTDIQDYFPAFSEADLPGNLNFIVLRDLVISNIFSARISPSGDAEVVLNYTLKKYRDYKVGRYIFEKENQILLDKGVKRIVYMTSVHKNHLRFLKVMGFEKQSIHGRDCFVKNI
ncbi:MAG: YgjV family protein [Chitinophagaceae bacterium]|nr:YgjV family protein [Chitinophagaceae bacterium]